MSFLDLLEEAETLKIKYKGKMYPVPNPIYRQAKKFALESVGVDYEIFKENPTSKKQKEKEVKKAFETFLESYLEAIVPDTKGNPSKPKSVMAFNANAELSNPDPETNASASYSLFSKWFKNSSMLEKKGHFGAYKGAIMYITHLYMEGVAGISKGDYGHSNTQTDEDKENIHVNELMRSTLAAIFTNVVFSIYNSTDPTELRRAILSQVPRQELGDFFKNDDKKKIYFSEIRNRVREALKNFRAVSTVLPKS